MMSKRHVLLVFLSFIMISLCVSTVVAADSTDKSVDDITIQQNNMKSVDTTQTAIDALEKGKTDDNIKTAASSNTYYVATNGKSSNAGTESSPFDLKTGVTNLQRNKGGNLIVNGGTYKLSETIKFYEGTYTVTGKSGQSVIFDAQNKFRHFYLGGSSNVEIKNIVFTNGNAADMGNSGGAIKADAGAKKVITNNTFKNNYASQYGGAISTSADNMEITNNIFTSNVAGISGGAITTTAKNTKITGNTFTQNSGARNGGAVYNSGSGTLVQNNKFTKNLSNQTAAAIYNTGDSVTIEKNVFQQNTASRTGGAIYDDSTGIKILNNEFTANNVKLIGNIGDGAAAYIRGSKATITGNTFTDNSAAGSAGAVYLDTGGQATVSKNTFTTNKASNYGGALYSRGTGNKITDNTFIMNTDPNSKRTAIVSTGTGATVSNNKNADTSKYYGTICSSGNSATITGNTFEDTKPVVKVATVVTVSKASAAVEDKMTLSATVKGVDGKAVTGGVLVFKINNKTVSNKIDVKNGVATTTVVAQKGFNNGNITASYGGTTNYLANKTATAAKATVSLRNAKLSLTVDPKTNQQYETVTFTAKVTDAATGKAMANNAKAYVIFKINGKTLKDSSNKTLKVKINNGVATYNYTIPKGTSAYTTDGKVKEYVVTTSLFNPNYNTPAKPTDTFTVKKSKVSITTTKLAVDMSSRKLIIKGNIKDYKNNNVIGASKLNVKINGVSIKVNNATTFNIKDGVINLSIDLPEKVTNIKFINNITLVTGPRTAYESYRVTTTNFEKA